MSNFEMPVTGYVLSAMYYVLRFDCRVVRAGRRIWTPLAEREHYTGTILHNSVQIVQNVV